MLGLTMRLSQLASASAWADGLILAALLAFVIRPVLGGPDLPARAPQLAGTGLLLVDRLRGAVPILLGMAIVQSGNPPAPPAA